MMVRYRSIFFAAAGALLLFSAHYTQSAETDWLNTDGGNVRIVVEPIEVGQTFLRAMIDIDLFDGWKTYWIDPGSGGITPTIQPLDSINFAISDMFFPVPNRIESKFGDYAGYKKPVKIPFILNSSKPLIQGEIDASVMVGICKEICIPAFSDFKLPVTVALGTTPAMLAVQGAFDALPKPPENLGMTISVVKLDGQQVEITVGGPQENLELFVSGKTGEQFKAPRTVSKTSLKSVLLVEPVKPIKSGKSFDFVASGRTSKGDFQTTTLLVF